VQTSQVRILLSPLKRFKQLKRFFFANNLAGSPGALGLLPTITLQTIDPFFLFTLIDIFIILPLGNSKKNPPHFI